MLRVHVPLQLVLPHARPARVSGSANCSPHAHTDAQRVPGPSQPSFRTANTEEDTHWRRMQGNLPVRCEDEWRG